MNIAVLNDYQDIEVNRRRSQLIESGAIIAALHAGRPGLAAIDDVFEHEPLTDIARGEPGIVLQPPQA